MIQTLSIPESKDASAIDDRILEFFGKENITFRKDGETTSQIASSLLAKFGAQGIKDVNQVAVLRRETVAETNSQVLVVQLDPKAKTAVGMLRTAVKLLIARRSGGVALLPANVLQIKDKGQNYYVYLPLVEPIYLQLIQAEQKAQMAIGASA